MVRETTATPRAFVPGSLQGGEAGLTDPPASPFRDTFGGWVLGSRDFVERLRALAGPVAFDPPLREARQLGGLDPSVVLAAVTEYYGLEAAR